MTDSKKLYFPALLAVGSSLAAGGADALELGDVQVRSALGQPLRASIAFALAPQEQLADYCVSVQPLLAAGTAATAQAARVQVANGVISIRGTDVVREPLVSVRVAVQCPNTARLSREYTLFIDPPGAHDNMNRGTNVSAAQIASPPIRSQRPAALVTAADRPRNNSAVTAPIAGDSRYQVQPGDSVSSIARRIENRTAGLWATVDHIHAANPGAFIDNDPNKLMAGAWLSIPGEIASDVTTTAAPLQSVADPASQAAAEVPAPSATISSAASPASSDTGPVPATYAEAIQELELRASMRSTSANVPVASIVAAEASPVHPAGSQPTRGSLWWLVAAGALLLGGLLAFGRRRSTDDDPAVVATSSHPLRRATDSGEVPALVADDYDLDDNSPTAENPVLDADLVLGMGFDTATDMVVSEDFGYATNTDLDLLLPDEAPTDDRPETDIIAPPRIQTSSILDSEVLPEDDDYDMSVLMDVTRAPDFDDVTERDLKAVEVANDDTLLDDSYTVSQEVDFEVLEQDYEDELTATQALNLEIERAAAELVAETQNSTDSEAPEITARQKATVTELVPTARLKTG